MALFCTQCKDDIVNNGSAQFFNIKLDKYHHYVFVMCSEECILQFVKYVSNGPMTDLLQYSKLSAEEEDKRNRSKKMQLTNESNN